jgi:hypothetical protein
MAVALRDLERGHARSRPPLRIVHSRAPVPPTSPAVYWLRRVFVLAVIVAAIFGAVMALRATASAASPAPARIEMTMVVSDGETLWDVARRYAPAGADRSAWVVDVATRNALDPATIRPGTPVLVPVEGQQVLAIPQAPAGR